jgi:hypothetical protein
MIASKSRGKSTAGGRMSKYSRLDALILPSRKKSKRKSKSRSKSKIKMDNNLRPADRQERLRAKRRRIRSRRSSLIRRNKAEARKYTRKNVVDKNKNEKNKNQKIGNRSRRRIKRQTLNIKNNYRNNISTSKYPILTVPMMQGAKSKRKSMRKSKRSPIYDLDTYTDPKKSISRAGNWRLIMERQGDEDGYWMQVPQRHRKRSRRLIRQGDPVVEMRYHN